MAERIKREAKLAKLPFDIMDTEGLLTRGALYLPELSPSFSYQEQLKKANKSAVIKKLTQMKKLILEETNIKNLFLDEKKLRLLLAKSDVKKHKKYFHKLKLKPAIVKEYPTYDQLEIELKFV